MFGTLTSPPEPTGRYALTVGVQPRAVLNDDMRELDRLADRMRGAEVRVKLVDGTEHVVGVVDMTAVRRCE